MRYLAFAFLSTFTRTLAQSLSALSIGTDVWGIRLVLTRSGLPEECGPMIMYYNITPVSGAPDWVVWPDTAVIHFLTPESAENEWMTWRPPIGEGFFNWTVPLPAGKQFVVKNFNPYEEVFTVSPGTSGCGEEGSTTSITFNYGTLDSSIFERLVTQTFPSYNITPNDQFSAVEMPSTDNLKRIDVPLGLDAASTIPETTQAPAVKTTSTSTPNSGAHSTSLPAIIGGLCGALVFVAVLFAVVLCLRRRRGRRQQGRVTDPTVSPVPLTPGFDSNDAFPATSDEKRSHATRLFVPSPKDPNHEPAMAATSTILVSEVLDPDRFRQAPPEYSQQA